jgi:hypothetical protein
MRHGFHFGKRGGFQIVPHGGLLARVPAQRIGIVKTVWLRSKPDVRNRSGKRF